MLRIYLGNELLEFDDDDLDYMYVDEGNEAEVYRYGKNALKVYKDFCMKDRLDEEDAQVLSTISTQRILLPQKMIRDADSLKFKGYSMPFIYAHPNKSLLRMRMTNFLSELSILDRELHILSGYGVAVSDMHIDNLLYNGKIFIGDPGSFIIDRGNNRDRVYRESTYELSKLVRSDIFGMVPLSKPKRRIFNEIFYDSEYIGYQIEDTMKPEETVMQYVKRMTR